jgi:DNA end-binding protein Ku
MPAAIATHTLTFGLVAIPVQILTATSSHRIAFRQIHTADHGRVRNIRVCEIDGKKLELDEITRAYEAGGHLVPIKDWELDDLPLPTARTIEVSGFLDLASIPGEMFDKPYFLAPQSQAANKPYVLFREALKRAGKGAVGKYAIRGSENLGLIYPQGDVLVLHRLRWPDEIRAAADAAPASTVDITAEELQGALGLIDALGDVDMQQMHDDYSRAVEALIDAKLEHAPRPKVPKRERADAGQATDLMTVLQQAAEQARAERGEDADVHHMADRKPAKKTASKKTAAAKKTAAKKTTAKKAAAKKTTAKRGSGKRAG